MTFYDQNELIAFPLVGDDDDGIPHDLIVDCIVHAPKVLGEQLEILSMSVTSLLVSVVLSIDGTAVAYLTVLKDQLTIHQPLQVTAIATGVSGYVAFGEGATRHLLRVDGPYRLVPSSLIRFDYDTTSATMTAGGHPFYGLVKLVGANGIKITGKTIVIGGVGDVLAAFFEADNPSMMDDPVPACLRQVEGNPQVRPITSINGIPPTCEGAFSLTFKTVQETSDVPEVTVVNGPINIRITDPGTPCE